MPAETWILAYINFTSFLTCVHITDSELYNFLDAEMAAGFTSRLISLRIDLDVFPGIELADVTYLFH